jgi:hypothetical protein
MTVREYLEHLADLVEREYDPAGDYWHRFLGLAVKAQADLQEPAEQRDMPHDRLSDAVHLRASVFVSEQGISGPYASYNRPKDETVRKLRLAARAATEERVAIVRAYVNWEQTVRRVRLERYVREMADTRPADVYTAAVV